MVISRMKALNLDTEDIGSETPKALRGWGMGKFFSSVKSQGFNPNQPRPDYAIVLIHSRDSRLGS